LAVAYQLSSPHRISDQPYARGEYEKVLRLHRGLRVLGFGAMFPLVSETYVHDELRALEAHGVELAFARSHHSVSPLSISQRVYQGLATGVREFRPDLIVAYWATHAEGSLAELESCRVPFAVRVHSFDFLPARLLALQAHPLCLGIWAYPHHVEQVPGAHALVPLFTSVDQLPAPAPQRDLLVSISAGLPKKRWEFLVDAFARLTGVERRIVVAVTNGHENVPSDLARWLGDAQADVLLQVNLDRAEVFRLLSRTAALVYTLSPEQPFGMPMSVIEALCSGASVVVPDRPEARALAGPGFRGYRDVDELVNQVREVLAGGPTIEAQRRAGQEFARAHFCGPAGGRRFFQELSAALHRWRQAKESPMRQKLVECDRARIVSPRSSSEPDAAALQP